MKIILSTASIGVLAFEFINLSKKTLEELSQSQLSSVGSYISLAGSLLFAICFIRAANLLEPLLPKPEVQPQHAAPAAYPYPAGENLPPQSFSYVPAPAPESQLTDARETTEVPPEENDSGADG